MMSKSSIANSLASLVAIACLLAGCVLQSPTALFAEAQGVAALDQLGSRFTSESLSNGEWKAEEGEISFRLSGQHYVAQNSDDKSEVEILFAPLDGKRFVMQAEEEKGKPFAYMIAEVTDGHLLLSPLLCDVLKTSPGIEEKVTFDGTDCSVKGTGDIAYFSDLAGRIGAAPMRLTPVN